MDKTTLETQIRLLEARRAELLGEVAVADAALQEMREEREIEVEERAQSENLGDVLARLDDRGKQEIEAIDAALARIRTGSYGVCISCGKAIALPRLRALPTAAFCVDCAAARERPPRA